MNSNLSSRGCSRPRVRWLLGAALAFNLLLSYAASAGITTQGLKDTEVKVREIVQKSMPCTVALIPADPAAPGGSGSGVIVSEDGLILTAAHVLVHMNGKVTAIFPDGKRVTAKVLGMDLGRDSAMAQITDVGKYPHVDLGDSKAIQPNDWCVALGHSGGFQADRFPPVRLGRVIANHPKTFLTTDSALIGGDSGGPLFGIDGRLIGINSNIGFSLAQNNDVPIATFVENWDLLKSGQKFGDKKKARSWRIRIGRSSVPRSKMHRVGKAPSSARSSSPRLRRLRDWSRATP